MAYTNVKQAIDSGIIPQRYITNDTTKRTNRFKTKVKQALQNQRLNYTVNNNFVFDIGENIDISQYGLTLKDINDKIDIDVKNEIENQIINQDAESLQPLNERSTSKKGITTMLGKDRNNQIHIFYRDNDQNLYLVAKFDGAQNLSKAINISVRAIQEKPKNSTFEGGITKTEWVIHKYQSNFDDTPLTENKWMIDLFYQDCQIT